MDLRTPDIEVAQNQLFTATFSYAVELRVSQQKKLYRTNLTRFLAEYVYIFGIYDPAGYQSS